MLVWVAAWLLYLALEGRRGAKERDGIRFRAASGWTVPTRPTTATIVLLIPVVIVCAAMLFRATFMPVWVWDSWAIWDLKARAFFVDRSVVPFVSDTYYALSHPDYPLLVPLAGTLMYLVSGGPHAAVQVVPVLFYCSTLVVFFSMLRRLGSAQAVAAALTAGLAFLPNLLQWSQHFQSESAFVFYALSYVCYLFMYDRDPRRWYLVVAALTGAFLTQTRAEGWFLVVPGALLLAARVWQVSDVTGRKRAAAAAIGFIFACVAIYAPWLALRDFVARVSGGVSQAGFAGVRAGLGMLPDVLAAMLQWMADTSFMGEYTLLFPLAFVLVLMNWRRYARPSGESFALLVGIASVVPPVVAYLVTSASAPWLTVNAMGRYLIVLTVLAYFILALHTVEATRTTDRAAARALLARTAVALAGALFVVSLPTMVSKIGGQSVSWSFENGPDGWKGEDLTAGPSGLGPLGSVASLVTPPIRLDADLIRTIRVTATGTPGSSGRLTLAWKRLRGEHSPDQTVTMPVAWGRTDQTMVVTPPWRGVIEEFILTFDGESGVVVQSVKSEPRWLSVLGLILRTERWNLAAFVALALVFLAAMGLLRTRDDLQRALAAGFAAIILVFWLATDVSSVLSIPLTGGDYTRPITLTRKVAGDWARLGGLDPKRRVDALEADAGRAQFGPLIEATTERCGRQGDVVVFAGPDRGDARPAGYVHQRAAYLLFPSRVFPVSQRAQLEALFRQPRPVAAMIVYGTKAPEGVGGTVVLGNEDNFLVVCDPRLV